MSIEGVNCPFQPGTMITDPSRFWGRKSERLTLISRLNNMGSSAITGSRRIGKSSLAFHVYTHCKSNFTDRESVWVDCQDINIKSINGLFQQVNSNSSLNYTSGKTRQECLKNFASAVTASEKKLLLFIDEFDVLTNTTHRKQFDEDFFMQLRMLAGQGGKLALVLVSKEPLQEICKYALEISSPFYNIFSSLPLSTFSNSETNEFLNVEHESFRFSKKEKELIKSIDNYCHPLVLQVVGEAVFINRQTKETNEILKKKIYYRVSNYLNHEEIQFEREKAVEMEKKQKEPVKISKPLDIFISIFVPVLGIVIIVLEFGLLFQYLDNFKATLLSLVSILLAMVVLLFAGRSIEIIGETTFFKLYSQLIKKIPLLSNLLNIDIKSKK